MASSEIIVVPNLRLSFPDLFRPGKENEDKKTGKKTPGKFGGQFILDKFAPGSTTELNPAYKLVSETMLKVAQGEFGTNWQNVMRAMDKKNKCLRDGNDNLDKAGNVRDGYAGKHFIKASNQIQPLLIGSRKVDGKFPKLIESEGIIYGGCYVNAKFEIRAMKAFENVPSQVYAKLLTVQFLRKGDAFAGGQGTEEGFDDVGDAPEMDEGNAGMDDLLG